MKISATIQVDVDNIWTHLADLGICDDSHLHVIYEESIVRFLDLFKRKGIKATFFCIGKDAQDIRVKRVLRQITEQGHEIASHSQNHVQNFSSLPYVELEKEIAEAEEILSQVTGLPIRGFKSPGWGLNTHTLEILSKRKYLYDASIMPSYFLPMLSLARFILSKGVKTNKTFGKMSMCLAPLHPYTPVLQYPHKQTDVTDGAIIELPNSVFPGIRMPFHSTFVYLLGTAYLQRGLKCLKHKKTPLNYVFHALDLLPALELLPEEINPRLRVFPAMKYSLEARLQIMECIIDMIKAGFEIKTSQVLAAEWKQ